MEIAKQLQATRITESPDDIIGSIRINPKCYTDAFVPDPKGVFDIFISGAASRGVALEGDIVQVKIKQPSEWKLNWNAIALRWDDWSNFLSPIIENLEIQTNEANSSNHHLDVRNTGETTDELDLVNLFVNNGRKNREARKKRHISTSVDDEKSPNEDIKKEPEVPQLNFRFPSNLPPGIGRLKVHHVSNLPFASQCIQKTGTVVRIVKRNHAGFAGGYLKKYSVTHNLFSPIDSRIPRMLIHISQCPIDFATSADRYKDILFVAKLGDWIGDKNLASGSLIKIAGDSNAIESRIEVLLMENQIYDTEFPPEVYQELKYLENLPSNWFARNSLGRRDLTNECIFTIDPKTARDLDDAVSIKKVSEQVYEVGVHIADVSYFVNEMTAVDYHARLRTTSVYLVDRVIPMLPRPLCEHMCSLNPNEPKLTFSVIWKMDKHGRIIDEWFGRTIIRSCVKLAYENAQDIIDKSNDLSWIQEDVNMPKLYAHDWKQIAKSIIQLNKIAQNRRAKRFENGALRIEQVKLKYELDKSTNLPLGFTFETRTDSNFLIEEFMLQANMSVAKKIYKYSKQLAFLRRHPSSCPRVLQEVKDFCDAKGFPLDISSAGSIQKSLNAIDDVTTSKVVSFLLLRAMKNAEYICTGSLPEWSSYKHFALNVPFYTHFTSPIRRYADIIVHRQLSLALDYEKDTNEDLNTLKLMADECTKRKISSKLISDTSQKLFFNLFIQKTGFCELLACVTRIMDHSFEVILVDYNQTGRVYMDRLKNHLVDFKFESFSGVKRLVLNWRAPPKNVKKSKALIKAAKMKQNQDEERLNCRLDTEIRKGLTDKNKMRVNDPTDDQQIIEVFDVIRVIVTVDEKDISKLKIDLKTPNPV